MITINQLQENDLEIIDSVLKAETREYLEHFDPSVTDINIFRGVLMEARNDQYFAIRVKQDLVGFYMLRGLDKGYSIPAYGVYISSKYSGVGLARLTLEHAKCTARVYEYPGLCLTVYKNNNRALRLYELSGFSIQEDKSSDKRIFMMYQENS